MVGVFVELDRGAMRSWSKPCGYVLDGNGCWTWVGSRNQYGYGQFAFAGRHGKLVLAHRHYFRMAKGPIPDGMNLDHLCRNRDCVNPDHLEVVTVRENLRRGATRMAANLSKTHCPHGHPYSGANLKIDRRGWRKCLTCYPDRRHGTSTPFAIITL